MLIKNARTLLSHGKTKPRKILIDLLETGLRSVDLYAATKRSLRIKKNVLFAEGELYDLTEIDHVYVVGAGKATFAIAKALEEILGKRITDGIVSLKKGEKRRLDRIRIIESGHPIPDKNSARAAIEICELAKKASSRDLFICAITGGASSLLVAPPEGVSLKDKIALNKVLLDSGAPINAMNSVRNHVSKIKGGRLARQIHPARILNLIAIDEIEELPWGPTVPDRTTFSDSIDFLKKFNLWAKIPENIKNYLTEGLKGLHEDTPKEGDTKNMRIQNVILASNEKMLEAVQRRARRLGLAVTILTSKLEGESSVAGKVFGSIAFEVETRNRPLKPPCALIAGGETTVKVDRAEGKGGPSQEFVLGSAMEIANASKENNIAVASLDTDGTDGPTDAAGGIVDSVTADRCKSLEEDIVANLNRHSSHDLLRKLEDTIITGVTATNVMDLDIAVVLQGDEKKMEFPSQSEVIKRRAKVQGSSAKFIASQKRDRSVRLS